jgi:hypothetical protein
MHIIYLRISNTGSINPLGSKSRSFAKAKGGHAALIGTVEIHGGAVIVHKASLIKGDHTERIFHLVVFRSGFVTLAVVDNRSGGGGGRRRQWTNVHWWCCGERWSVATSWVGCVFIANALGKKERNK